VAEAGAVDGVGLDEACYVGAGGLVDGVGLGVAEGTGGVDVDFVEGLVCDFVH
jgi:hypothetical protein